MALTKTDKVKIFSRGEPARLMPVVADTKQEDRLTSCTLAAFMSVNDFANVMLKSIGISHTKTSKVECFTQVGFKSKNKNLSGLIPDGLIVVQTGGKKWSALVEAKSDNNDLKVDQVENYLDIAREQGIDAVITISNQFATNPTISPINVNNKKTQTVKLYHWSWRYLMTEALICTDHKENINDDQKYILGELVRYLEHKKSGVKEFSQMSSTWKDFCNDVRDRKKLKKTSEELKENIEMWHQYVRDLSFNLSVSIGEHASVYLKSSHKTNNKKRIDDEKDMLIKNSILQSEFNIPKAASRVLLEADLHGRKVSVSMRAKSPSEKTIKAQITWLLRDLKKADDKNKVVVCAIWKGQSSYTRAKLAELENGDYDNLIGQNTGKTLTEFKIEMSRDLGDKFSSRKDFVKTTRPLVTDFYEKVGQHLKNYQPPAPKVKEQYSDNGSDTKKSTEEKLTKSFFSLNKKFF